MSSSPKYLTGFIPFHIYFRVAFGILVIGTNIGLSFDINAEWIHQMVPDRQFSLYRFNDIELIDGTIIFSGSKEVEWDCVELPDRPSYFWLGALNDEENGFAWESLNGELLQDAHTQKVIFNDEFIILGGTVINNLNREDERICLNYFDSNGHYEESLIIDPPERGRENFESAFFAEDSLINLFSGIYYQSLYISFFMYVITENGRIANVREFNTRQDFGDGHLSFVTEMTKMRNGDYLLPGSFRIVRDYGNGVTQRGEAPFLARMNHEGDILWTDVRLDSHLYRAPDYHSFNYWGQMWSVVEHSSGFIYATGATEIWIVNQWVFPGMALYKYDPNGNLNWTIYYNDNYTSNSSYFSHIIELRPDRLALFGKIRYRAHDEREEGLYVALVDTSGELLTDTFIRGRWINDMSDRWADVLKIGPNRVLAISRLWDQVVSIRFSLDPPASIEFDDISAPPAAFQLEPAYPNPFNSSAVVRFALPAASPVKLEVYDIAGRRASTLQEGMLPAGRHSVRWDAAGMESGLYFIRLNTPSFQGSTKVLLLK